uniref:Uncharacterized protein n=1 Tax=Plectus sambesii TaxID=2011161 RepID=A0A914WRU2_9BILA
MGPKAGGSVDCERREGRRKPAGVVSLEGADGWPTDVQIGRLIAFVDPTGASAATHSHAASVASAHDRRRRRSNHPPPRGCRRVAHPRLSARPFGN